LTLTVALTTGQHYRAACDFMQKSARSVEISTKVVGAITFSIHPVF